MANERNGNDRRSMTISVTVLGVTLCVVFLAYFAFSEFSNDPDTLTVEFATVVSSINLFKNTHIFCFLLFAFCNAIYQIK